MAKAAPGSRATKAKPARRVKRKTLAELNAWMSANYAGLMKKARANSVRLTGKPTFGGSRRKKSA